MFHRKNPLFLSIAVGAFALILADNELKRVLQKGNNQFSGKVLSVVVKQHPSTNIILSGFSVLTPLGLLGIASRGATNRELINATGLRNNDYIFKIFSQITKDMVFTPEVEFKIANKLLVNMNYQLNDFFDVMARNSFNTEVNNIDFSNVEEAATKINNWVYEETNQRIEHLIDPSFIDENTRLILVNALYFKGKWKYSFSRLMTRAKTFTVNNERSVQVLMMHNTARYKYAESKKLDAKILEMPFFGDESSMVIVLPNEVKGIKELLNKLKNLSIMDMEMRHMKLEDVEVTIPKFKIETTINLKEVLQKMNVTKIFNNDAEITELLESDKPIFVNKMIQKAFIEVDEKGSEAAASNAVAVSFLSRNIPLDVKNFVADHPFVLFIKKNDITILSALYKDPSL